MASYSSHIFWRYIGEAKARVLKGANFGELDLLDSHTFKQQAKKRERSYTAGHEKQSVANVTESLPCELIF